MINLEKYKTKFFKPDRCDFDCTAHTLRTGSNMCDKECLYCRKENIEWLLEEYKEPEIDWSKVKRGTPVLVRDDENAEWEEKKFLCYEPDLACKFWVFSNSYAYVADGWEYCKLKEDETK